MGSVSKHQITKDRISNLPTNLIGSILSLLPTKDAVRTSVLSTHWKEQWILTTHLDFDDLSVRGTSTSQAMFVNFIYQVLLFKVRQLELFRLNCHKDYGVMHVNAWVFAALSRNVREIDIKVPLCSVSHFQTDCLFSSRTLVVLKLGNRFLVRVPKLISLVSLKTLHFELVGFEDSESLSSCPVLEEFQMKERYGKKVNVIKISSPKLKRLILRNLCLYDDNEELLSCKVVINTPNLEYLEHVDTIPDGFHIETLHCLERARLCLEPTDETELYADPMIVYPMEVLAVAISNVRFLHLYDYTLESFRRPGFGEARLPEFPRLLDLKIDLCSSKLQLVVLAEFLESTPQLASLSFDLSFRRPGFVEALLPKFPRLMELEVGACYSGQQLFELTKFLESTPKLAYLSFQLTMTCRGWHPPINVPFCMQYNLTVIKVRFGAQLEMEQLDIVKYFLNNTNCLKEVKISGMMEHDGNVIKNVLMFPRASKSCKIVIT